MIRSDGSARSTADGGGVGVWMIGARGSVASTVVAGAAAIADGCAPIGCVTAQPRFDQVPLPSLHGFVFGGHDIVERDAARRIRSLVTAGVLPLSAAESAEAGLRAAWSNVRPGIVVGDSRTESEQIAAVTADLVEFRDRHALDTVVVVNVSSTEAPATPHPACADLEPLTDALAGGESVLPVSSRYAYAALNAGCAFVDFTPSTGARLPGLAQLARRRGVPFAGSDGKTGETLLRSVLAPMFATRALTVRSWSGTNLLGGGDGATLADPRVAASKLESKNRTVRASLGYPVTGQTHIDYVPDLGEWKTAWDHVVFQGFLGTTMQLQFTWQGCDSTLAAPLVLDLARLMAAAARAGIAGAVPELAFFFKDPVASDVHALHDQYAVLTAWADRLAEVR